MNDWRIYVKNIPGPPGATGTGNDESIGDREHPVFSADEAFRRLPPFWYGAAEIIFMPTGIPYPIMSDTVYLGTPIGLEAKPLVIRPSDYSYSEEFTVTASGGSGTNIVLNSELFLPDQFTGYVLSRVDYDGSVGPAISIRGSTVSPGSAIQLHASIGNVNNGDRFIVQRPRITLALTRTLNLTSHDCRALNLTLSSIKIEPALLATPDLNLFNVRAQCDTCEFYFPVGNCFVHTNSRIQGGIKDVNLMPSPSEVSRRAMAGVFIVGPSRLAGGTVRRAMLSAVRGGALGGYLTFRTVLVRVSQGGMFVPISLEALDTPIHILAGGTALTEALPTDPGGWGALGNEARIRNVEGADGDGLRVSNGGSISSGVLPLRLNIYGCGRDGIRLEGGSTVSFGPPGSDTGLISSTSEPANRGFGMSIRNHSCALIGTDTALRGMLGAVTLDDRVVGSTRIGTTFTNWSNVPEVGAQGNAGSFVHLNI